MQNVSHIKKTNVSCQRCQIYQIKNDNSLTLCERLYYILDDYRKQDGSAKQTKNKSCNNAQQKDNRTAFHQTVEFHIFPKLRFLVLYFRAFRQCIVHHISPEPNCKTFQPANKVRVL